MLSRLSCLLAPAGKYRPIRDGGQKAKTRRSGSFYENLGTQKSQSIFVDFSIFHDDAKVFIWVGNDV